MRDGHNGYVASAGIEPARQAVAEEYTRRGVPMTPDRVVITSAPSQGIELTPHMLVDAGDEVLIPSPTYPLDTAAIAKIGAKSVFYHTDPRAGWQPDLDHIRSLITPRTRALVVIDPNNPTGAVYPEATRRALIDIAERAGIPILADEVYSDIGVRRSDGVDGIAAPDAPIISFSSLSKAYLAPGWRTGWLVVATTERLNGVLAATRKMADGRLCSPGPFHTPSSLRYLAIARIRSISRASFGCAQS